MPPTDETETTETTIPPPAPPPAPPPEETTPAAPTTPPPDAPPTDVSLDVVSALHTRVVRLQGTVDELGAKLARVLGALNQIVTGLSGLDATVAGHASDIDEIHQAISDLRAGAATITDPAPSRVPLAPGMTEEIGAPTGRTTHLLVDPKKAGIQTVTLPGGQQVDIRVGRASTGGAGAVLRDGKRGTPAGTRRT